MAEIIDNPKGFLVIKTSHIECISRIGGYGVCDYCAKASDTGYYIAVLNQWFCPDCYKAWIRRSARYREDIPIEKRNFEKYRKILNV